MHSIPRPLEEVDFPSCKNADMEWDMRIPTGPSLVDHKVKMLLGQCEKQDATPEATRPMTDNQLYTEMGRNACWNKSNTVLLGQTQYSAGWSGKKGRYCTTLIPQISFDSAVIQMQGNHLTRQLNEAILHSIMVTA